MTAFYDKLRHDVGIKRTDGTDVGLMLATINGKPAYRTLTERYLRNQYYAGTPDYGALDPQSELPMILDDWRSGFGLEVADSADPKRYFSSIGMDLRFRGMAIAGPTPTTISFPDKNNVPTIVNDDMELETGWDYSASEISRSDTQKQADTYSLKYASAGGSDRTTDQYVVGWTPGVQYTFKCYVWGDQANSSLGARIGIDDGQTETWSAYRTTSSFAQLTVQKTMASNAKYMKLLLDNDQEGGAGVVHYFDEASITMDDSSGAITYSGLCRAMADFDDDLYFTLDAFLTRLNSAGTTLLTVLQLGASITDLEPFTDDKLYICLGWSDAYWQWSGKAGYVAAVENTLSNNTMKFMTTVFTTADTMYGVDTNNSFRKTVNPADGGTAWTDPATTVGADYHDITDTIEKSGAFFIMKEDMPYYLDSSGNVQRDLAPELASITRSTSGKNVVLWKNNLYIPAGLQALLETDGTTNTFRNPSAYCTNLTDFVGRIQALGYDEEYLFVIVDNSDKVEVLACRLETIDGTTSWVVHPMAEITLAGCETAFVSSVYQKRLWIASTLGVSETLRPNAAGDECNFDAEVGDVCPDHYLNVDEAIPDEDTTYVGTKDPWLRDLYNIEDSSGSGTIRHITVYARCRALATPDQTSLKIAIKSGTGTGAPDTVTEGNEETLTTSYANYSKQWTTNPATGSAWTWDEIDKLQAGIALRACKGPPSDKSLCTQVYVEVGGDDLYYIPLPVGYGDIENDANRKFKTDTYFITPWLHGGFKGEDKAFIKATATLGHSYDTDIYFELHYQKKGDSSWTDAGDFKGTSTNRKPVLYIPNDSSGNKPVSPMMRFKIVAKTDDTNKTPILLSLDIRTILRPTHRKIIELAVRCQDKIMDRRGLPLEGTSAEFIREVLEEARDAVWPFTFYDPWGNSKTCVVLPIDMESEIVTDLKNENPEQLFYLRLQEVSTS